MDNKGKGPLKIRVCVDAKCADCKGKKIARRFKEALREKGLDDCLRVSKCDCLGKCKHGPVVAFPARKLVYEEVAPNDVKRILKEIVSGL